MKIMIKAFMLMSALLVPFSAFSQVKEYSLSIDKKKVQVAGYSAERFTINGSLPGPTLEFTEGDEAVIHVKNDMNEPTSVHWHGLLVPALMDGVPNFNGFTEIQPGKSFTYRFPIRQSGTYWYHSHSGTQEQDGLYGAIVIKPKAPKIKADKDYVVMLSEFHPQSGDEILKGLTQKGHHMHGGMMDLSDVKGYTFLTNGLSPEEHWMGGAEKGDKVRLRFINGGAASYFDVTIPGLDMSVVSADGQLVEPVNVDKFRIAPGETYDVVVQLKENSPYQIEAKSIDNAGAALGMLGSKKSQSKMMVTQQKSQSEAQQHMHHDQQKASNTMDHSMHGGNGGSMMARMAKQWKSVNVTDGEKVLDYKDLKLLGTQGDLREPEREIVVTLDGGMKDYIWTMDGKTAKDAKPIELKYGERVRLTFVNHSMMAHPMHLHGMFMQLDNGQKASKLPNKHTVNIAPGETYSVLLTANEVGEWAFHCHLFYHMATGMMNKVVVAKLDKS